MRLDSVQITNFRSVKNDKITFNFPCRILVGINESGKTNILNALYTISSDYKINSSDIRTPLPTEKPISESLVSFSFIIQNGDVKEILQCIEGKTLYSKNRLDNIATVKGEQKTIQNYVETFFKKIDYDVNLLKNSKQLLYYKTGLDEKDIIINQNLRKIKDGLGDDILIENAKGEKIQINKFRLVNIKDFPNIEADKLEELTETSLNGLIGKIVTDCLTPKIPKVIFWQYKDEFVIPNQIKIEDFKNNPDICKPLKNMFIIAGYSNIKENIDQYLAQSGSNPIDNFLGSVGKKATRYFRSIWKEYKTIEFNLRTNGENIIPSVQEKNRFDFNQRSDGFKKFVSFLLLISVNVNKDLLSNSLILTDEPENGLHPSGSRYLRDELINISFKNYVVYSTHSIFMIDKEKIKRNLIIKKDKEITKIKEVTSSRIADEEVIYNALNYSIFDSLKEENILFEGWKDKKLFNVAINKLTLIEKRKFNSFGICHAQGVKSIKNITPLLELANKKCTIISDNDPIAKQYKDEFEKNKHFGRWFKYDDIDPYIEAVTGEDFLKNTYIEKELQSLQSKNTTLSKVTNLSISRNKNKLDEIKNWVIQNGFNTKEASEFIEELKNNLFDRLTLNDIEDKYINLLKNLVQKF